MITEPFKKYLDEIENQKPCAVQMVNYVSNQKEPELLKYSVRDKITLLTEKIGSGDFKQYISCVLKNKKANFCRKMKLVSIVFEYPSPLILSGKQ